MQDALHLFAAAALLPLMAVALSLPFYVTAWLRGGHSHGTAGLPPFAGAAHA